MWTLGFWKQVAERAIKTAAQAALAFFVVGQTVFADVNWLAVAGAAGVGAIASVLTSIASIGVGQPDSPSAVEVSNG